MVTDEEYKRITQYLQSQTRREEEDDGWWSANVSFYGNEVVISTYKFGKPHDSREFSLLDISPYDDRLDDEDSIHFITPLGKKRIAYDKDGVR
uniref:Uncharacterized protein n=1 Tax=Candidatus Kentrum sp. DK TaxID=2126562 RepID=A0A450SEU7_9GAMM|nr:MAG: hypothetical protein BECKDK2373B_GA0170837_103235 [Candidatus Kentron sp. DK]